MPAPRSIVELILGGTLDAELAAQLWLLLEAGVPVVVAGAAPAVGTSTLLGAVLAFLPGEVRVVVLAGDGETFDWMPQATELGWPGVARARKGIPPARPGETLLLADGLSDQGKADTWGEAARVAVRAASIGYGLAATIPADSLDEVLHLLGQPPVRLADDELTHLGVVLVLRRLDDGRRRVAAAHYVRPLARDTHGHLQRLGPAVLATWDPAADRFEHFGWGITPELAARVGRRAGDFEVERERRRTLLEDLAGAGRTAPDEVRRALLADRSSV